MLSLGITFPLAFTKSQLLHYTYFAGAVATYARFFPSVKNKCDYGVLIFLLTFSMITVSGYRVENISRMAYERFATILIGFGVCLVVSLLIFPTWAGQDLHNSTVRKLQGLGKSLQGKKTERKQSRLKIVVLIVIKA